MFSNTGNFKERHSTNQCNFQPSQPSSAQPAGKGRPTERGAGSRAGEGYPKWDQFDKSLTLVGSAINQLHAGFSSASALMAAILSFLLVLLSKLWPTLGIILFIDV